MRKYKFSDYKKDFFSEEELIEETKLVYGIWDDYDEFDEYYHKFYDDFDELEYLEPHNYFPITYEEKRKYSKIHRGHRSSNYIHLRQVDLSTFTSLEMKRKKKLKSLFGESEEYEFRNPTFGDLMKNKTK